MGDASKVTKDSDFGAIVEIGFREDGTSEIIPCSSCAYKDRIEDNGVGQIKPGLYKIFRITIGEKEKAYRVCPAFFDKLKEDTKYCERLFDFPDAYIEDCGKKFPYNMSGEEIGTLDQEMRCELKDKFEALGCLGAIEFFDALEKDGPVPKKVKVSADKPLVIPKIRVKVSKSKNFDKCSGMMGILEGMLLIDLHEMGYEKNIHETEDTIYFDFEPSEQMKEKLAKGINKIYGNRMKDKIARFGKKLKG